ncbi:toxin-activating lysine-acyltransferase RzcC [Thalassobius sp. Cn5-15]|uniref:toxin-activating lysine-acyltransferase RzcC n=1 Tax=Thalassobius sp. Cn5-15 TaxID=2917763 RepID=UPI001EF177CF|nr:toxin-activating lysine-acyltransferase RzcC [Thalassobius sp. Cn5-15]MCG7495033.1 toxin-activating lysine-acyltransferase RzcC [Thalassobius sp. Cn5-15]
MTSSASANSSPEAPPETTPEIDPEVVKKIAMLRAQVRESFGKVVMAMMALPRYRHQTLADLQHLVLDPLIRDRLAIAYPADKERGDLADITGLAIWASVSKEADAKIREQIRNGVWPLRLHPIIGRLVDKETLEKMGASQTPTKETT